MESALLQQLLTKPVPQKQREVEIMLPQREGIVEIQTKIIDKTGLGYDGTSLRKKLQRFERVHREVDEEEEIIVPEVPEEAAAASPLASPLAPLPASPKKTAKKAPKASKAISIMDQTKEDRERSPPDLSVVV